MEGAVPKRAARAGDTRAQTKGGLEHQSSVGRMLSMLDLFTAAAPVRPVADLVSYLGASRSTSYRYIKALHHAGLIEAVSDGCYVLGPRIVEFDRQIRMSDPLYKGGEQVLRVLAEQTGHSALLCTLCADTVMCIREALSDGSPIAIFSRGQRRPLFSGAASKIVLPFLQMHRLRSIFKLHQRDIAIAGLGTDWQSFRRRLAAIRKDGYLVTYGEFNQGVFGISAPVFNADGLVVGSIGIAGAEAMLNRRQLHTLSESVVNAAKQLSEIVGAVGADVIRPPRAFGSGDRR